MGRENRRETTDREEVDALCRECGHAFKVYLDRVMSRDAQESELGETATCPVCGCNECKAVHKGSS